MSHCKGFISFINKGRAYYKTANLLGMDVGKILIYPNKTKGYLGNFTYLPSFPKTSKIYGGFLRSFEGVSGYFMGFSGTNLFRVCFHQQIFTLNRLVYPTPKRFFITF
jgi:hypothetical protein